MSTRYNDIISSKSQTPSREELLKRYFWGRTDVFDQWNRDTSEWQCIRRDVPEYLTKWHIDGKITIATYQPSAPEPWFRVPRYQAAGKIWNKK